MLHYWKKIAAGIFVFIIAVGISFVAYAQEFSFTNELSSGIVAIDNVFEEETSFAGITENAALEFSSEKVDAYLEIEFTLGTGTGNETSDTKHINFAVTDFDYYLDVRPFSFLTVALHDNLWMEGSYLPLWDDNAPGGGLGSTGITLMALPIEGLRISATIPIPPLDELESKMGNFIKGSASHGENEKFNIGFGIDYTFGDWFSIGAKAGDVINTDGYFVGGYAAVKPLESDELIFRLGFAHHEGIGSMEELDYSENVGIEGKNLYNFSTEYNAEKFSITVELAGDTTFSSDNDFLYDMYIGANFCYSITDSLSLALGGQCFLDFASDENAKPLFCIKPSITYAFGKHEFSFGPIIEICDKKAYAKFPISWTCSF